MSLIEDRMLEVERQVIEHGVHIEHLVSAMMELKVAQEHFVEEMRHTSKEIHMTITACKTANCDILGKEVDILEKEVAINRQQMGEKVLQKDFNERFDALEKKLRVLIYLSERPKIIGGVIFFLWLSTFDAFHNRLEAIIGKVLIMILGG